jgi:hypothetical protein
MEVHPPRPYLDHKFVQAHLGCNESDVQVGRVAVQAEVLLQLLLLVQLQGRQLVRRRQLRVDAGHDVTRWESLTLTKKFSLTRELRRRKKRFSQTSNNSNAFTLSPITILQQVYLCSTFLYKVKGFKRECCWFY